MSEDDDSTFLQKTFFPSQLGINLAAHNFRVPLNLLSSSSISAQWSSLMGIVMMMKFLAAPLMMIHYTSKYKTCINLHCRQADAGAISEL